MAQRPYPSIKPWGFLIVRWRHAWRRLSAEIGISHIDRTRGGGGRLKSGGRSKNAYNRSTLARTWVHRSGIPSTIFRSMNSSEMAGLGPGLHVSKSLRQNSMPACLLAVCPPDDQPDWCVKEQGRSLTGQQNAALLKNLYKVSATRWVRGIMLTPPRSRKRILETKQRTEITSAIFGSALCREFLNAARITGSIPPLARDPTSRTR